MSAQTQQVAPQAGSLPKPWLWQVWAAVIIALVVTLTAHFALRPPLAITPPSLSFLGDTCTVAFRATNNTSEPTSASLLVIAGIGIPGGDSTPPTHIEFARNTVSVSLSPGESKNLSCEFPVGGRTRPNAARIEIASTKIQVQ